MSIVFMTDGLIDIRAFTVLGLHAKPNSTNPIGKFGSGLKNCISVLVREDISVRVFIGLDEYRFYKSPTKFRDMDFDMIRMKKRFGFLSKWTYEQLPFATTFAKYWEVWQAFRELESNTRDENGTTIYVDGHEEVKSEPNKTLIVVEGEAFDEVYHERDKIFLPNALTKREGDNKLQVFNEPSNHLYWRGVRVFDLEKPSIYTYNILDEMTLTEDRTLKHVWEAQTKIAAYVARSKDSKLINAIISADADKFFEGRLDFDYTFVSPSAEFNSVVLKKRSRGAYVSPRALIYYDKYSPAPSIFSTLSTREKVAQWAYNTDIPDELQELLKHLLKCEIKEPEETDPDAMPY